MTPREKSRGGFLIGTMYQLAEKNKAKHTANKDIIMLSGFDFGEHRSTLAGQSRTPTLAGFF